MDSVHTRLQNTEWYILTAILYTSHFEYYNQNCTLKTLVHIY